MSNKDGLLASIIEDPSNETARLALADLFDDEGLTSFLREKGYWAAITAWEQYRIQDVFWIVSLARPIKATYLGRALAMVCHHCKKCDVLTAKGSFWSCNRSSCNPLYQLHGTLSLYQQVNPDMELVFCSVCLNTHAKKDCPHKGDSFAFSDWPGVIPGRRSTTPPTAYWREPELPIVGVNLETYDTTRTIIDSMPSRIIISPAIEHHAVASTDIRTGDFVGYDAEGRLTRWTNQGSPPIGIAVRNISQGDSAQLGLDIIQRGGTTIIED